MRRSESPEFRRALLLAVVYVLVLLVAVLFPFRFDDPVLVYPNGVRWLDAGNGVEFAERGLLVTASTPGLFHEALRAGSGLTVEAWIAPANLSQDGPARILTYSIDKLVRNFTLGQEGRDLVFRLRTSSTDLNGVRPHLTVPDVFDATDMKHVAVTYDYRTSRVYVDGERRSETAAPSGRFGNWDRGCRLAMGDELSGGRAWLGRVYLAAIYDRALSEDEVRRNHRAGKTPAPAGRVTEGAVALYGFTEGGGGSVRDRAGDADLTIPSEVRLLNRPFLAPPYRYFDARAPEPKRLVDFAINVALFVPLGFLAHRCLSAGGVRAGSAFIVAVAIGVALSIGIECLQFFLLGRSSSMTDVIHDAIGTAIGAVLARLRGPGRMRPSANRTAEPSSRHPAAESG